MFIKNDYKNFNYVNGTIWFIEDVNMIDKEFIVNINWEDKLLPLSALKDIRLSYCITIPKVNEVDLKM